MTEPQSERQTQYNYDLIVIGSGPAGYRAAVQAAKLKKSVCIVEATPGKLGGAWIHTGTIPSKTLRESMESIHNIRFHAGSVCVERIIREFSAAKLMAQATKVAQFEENIVRRYFDRYGIEVIEGFGSLEHRHGVRIVSRNGDARILTANFILLATGSRPPPPSERPL